MPITARQWGVPDSRVALSLVLWFASFSVFLLVCGPLSDKHGRRPILLAGLALFTAASAACALATNVTALIVLRILQGVGAALILAPWPLLLHLLRLPQPRATAADPVNAA